MDPGIQRGRRAAQGFEAHGRGSNRSAPEDLGIMDQERQQRGLRLGTVDECDSLLGRKAEGLESGPP
jgi:hypothetical protein